MEQARLEEIKGLIQKGFDLKLIAFELDIPIEQIRQLKAEIEERKAHTYENKKVDSQSYHKMQQMREKYRKLFSQDDRGESKPKNEQPKTLSPKEMQVIETIIENIKSKKQSMESMQRQEKRAVARDILDEFKKLFRYELTVEQIEELNMLLISKELENLGIDITDKKHYSINQVRRELTKKFAENVKYLQSESNDLLELQELEKKFALFNITGNEMLVGEVKRELSSKILKIQQQNAINRLRNDIPANIDAIITGLVNGNIDMQRANSIIDEEARRRVEEKPKTRFSLKEEQIRGQIILQIRTAIIEKADKYPIKNPEQAILGIQQLCGGELGFNISTVVRNLIARKKYETSKNICNRFSGDDVEPEIKVYIRILRDEVRNAEISELVLTGIKQDETPEKQAECFNLIKKGLDMGNVKLSSISLGKNKSGSKNITLADIWPEQIQR